MPNVQNNINILITIGRRTHHTTQSRGRPERRSEEERRQQTRREYQQRPVSVFWGQQSIDRGHSPGRYISILPYRLGKRSLPPDCCFPKIETKSCQRSADNVANGRIPISYCCLEKAVLDGNIEVQSLAMVYNDFVMDPSAKKTKRENVENFVMDPFLRRRRGRTWRVQGRTIGLCNAPHTASENPICWKILLDSSNHRFRLLMKRERICDETSSCLESGGISFIVARNTSHHHPPHYESWTSSSFSPLGETSPWWWWVLLSDVVAHKIVATDRSHGHGRLTNRP
jgi:hypothetical protein